MKALLGLKYRVSLSNQFECTCGWRGLSVQSLSQPFKKLRVHLEGCRKPSAKFKNELGTTGPHVTALETRAARETVQDDGFEVVLRKRNEVCTARGFYH